MTKARAIRVTGRVDFTTRPFVEHFKFFKAHTRRTPKMTIPAVLHFRVGRNNISKAVYPDLDVFFDDLAKAYRKAVKAFYDAGCRYLQLDDTVWAYLYSKAELQKARALHDNVEKLPRDLRRCDQLRDRREAGRHGHHDPRLPRQFPLDLDCRRRL
jgi:5-methyltetrahydropteroyltriglutamate--homocysteine methyltransferase